MIILDTILVIVLIALAFAGEWDVFVILLIIELVQSSYAGSIRFWVVNPLYRRLVR